MSEMIRVRLEVYLPFRGRRLWRGEEAVAVGTGLAAFLGSLNLTEPELAVLINGRYPAPGTILQAGDEVSVLRQAEGGAGSAGAQ